MLHFIKVLFHTPYFGCFSALLVCFCFYYLKGENRPFKKYVWALYLLIFTGTFSIFIGSAIYRIYHPQVWDFTAFYLYGKVAALGYDFYLPASFHSVFSSLNLPLLSYKGFIEEVVNVGFLYPPPTILLFTPLGFFSYNTALILWTIFNLAFSMGCVYLIYDMFLKAFKLNGLIFVATLFCLFLPVLSTISFSQTNFIVLFLLLLMKKYEDRKWAGVLLALALFSKPYMIIFILVFIVRKQWKTLAYFSISSLGLIGLTVLFFGKSPFISYIFNNPSKRLPGWVFSENINQSLHAVLLRSNLIVIDKPLVYTYILAAGFLLTILYVIYLLKRRMYDYIWAILLLVGLLFYPGTLTYYGVLLLFVVFQFFDEKQPLGFHKYLNIPLLCSVYFFSSFSVFACICFLLAVIVLKSLKSTSKYTSSRLLLQVAT